MLRLLSTSKLHARFMLQLLPLLVLAFVLAALFTAWVTHRSQLAQAHMQRVQTLTVFGAALVKPLWDCDGTTVHAVVQAMTEQPSVLAVQVRDLCNATTWRAGQEMPDSGPDLLHTPLLHHDEQGGSHHVGTLGIAFHPLSITSAAEHGFDRQLVVFASMLATMLAGAAWAFGRIIGVPLEQLRKAMRMHAELDPIPAHWAEELHEIAQAYNTQVQELRHQARHDGLTGLGNRILLEEQMQQALHRAARAQTRGYVLLLDLNHFKPINDTYGHAAGDAVLQTVAQRLQACVRGTDTVARLGGDEFVILTADTPAETDVSVLVERIHRTLAQPIDWQGQLLHVGTSIGVAQFPRDGNSSAALLAHADAAMYAHKEKAR